VEELLRRYEPLIRSVVAGLRLPCGCERGDIAQEARIGLVRAIWAWRPERGPFRAFASSCARDEAIKAIDTAGSGKHQVLSRAVSLHSVSAVPTPAGTRGTACPSALDERLAETRPLADPVRTVLAREQLDEIRAALATLTAKERAALTGDLNGISQQQLASEHGWTEKAVHRSLRRARDKLGAREDRLAA
jgi:RNA polymerase sigma factor (sigma-70 family)